MDFKNESLQEDGHALEGLGDYAAMIVAIIMDRHDLETIEITKEEFLAVSGGLQVRNNFEKDLRIIRRVKE